MPAVSQSQRRLMGAAEHGADFPMARKVRASMSKGQMHDFAATKETGLPAKKKRRQPLGKYGQMGPKGPGGFGVTPPTNF